VDRRLLERFAPVRTIRTFVPFGTRMVLMRVELDLRDVLRLRRFFVPRVLVKRPFESRLIMGSFHESRRVDGLGRLGTS
jgi:hypothetical protein